MSKKKKSGNPGNQQNSPSSNAQGNRPNNAQGNRPNNAQGNRPNNAQGNNGSKNHSGQSSSKQPFVSKGEPSANKPFLIVDESRGIGKYIAGTYFEMSLGNFIRTLSYVFTRAGVSKLSDKLYDNYSIEKSIERVAKADLSASQMSNLSRLLFRHFPFFGPLMADKADYSLAPFRKEVKVYDDEIDFIKKKLRDKNAQNRKSLNEQLETARSSRQAAQTALERQIVGTSTKDMLEYLVTIAGALVYYRNSFSHKNHYDNAQDIEDQKNREQRLAKWLEIVFNGERSILLERKTYTQKETEFLTKDGPINYNVNKNKKSTRNNDFYFGPGRKTDKEWEITDFGRYFFCSLFLHRNDAELFAEEARLYADSPFKLSSEEKEKLQQAENRRAAEEQKYVNENDDGHTVNPRTIGDTESPQNNIVRDMLNMHRIHIPREKRIDADMSEGILLMDIMNELRRPPVELFDTFSPEDKAVFEKTSKDPNGNTVRNRLVRTSDRFPELAMRAIDQMELFKDIRFHLRLGRYRYRFYDKTLIDNTPILRTVQKDVNGFGRWQEVEKRRTEKYGPSMQQRTVGYDGIEHPVEDSADSSPYITDWRTTYNIHADRIGLAWNLPKMRDGMYLPDLECDDGDNAHRKALLDMPAPMCYLSVYDLPALLFYQYISQIYYGGAMPSAETIIKNKYDNLIEYFNFAATEAANPETLKAKQAELGLEDSEVPQKLLRFQNWDGADKRKKHATELLMAIVEEAKSRKESFDKKHKRIVAGGRDNRYGRRGHADIRYGSIARYVAKSLLRWQPAMSVKGGNKLTSYNYRALCDNLADYGFNLTSLDELRSILKRAGLIDSKNPHPFITDVLNSGPSNIEQLYDAYLDAEIAKCLGLIKDINQNKDVVLPSFVRMDALRWNTSLDAAAKRYMHTPIAPFDDTRTEHDAPIMLPDGLFTNHILKLMQGALNSPLAKENKTLEPMRQMLEEQKTNHTHYGAAYIIRYWFDRVARDKSQAFYGSESGKRFKRFYRAVCLLDPHREKNRQLIRDTFTESEISQKLKLTLEKNRQQLRDAVVKSYKLDINDNEAVDEKQASLLDQLHEVSDNERFIRRCRVQDIALFLMVRAMLTKVLSSPGAAASGESQGKQKKLREQTLERVKKMRLQDFGYMDDFKLFTSDEGSSYTYTHKTGIEIEMPALSLKNYGTIFRLLGDGERFEMLMEGLKELGVKRVTFAQLTAEMAQHDRKRTDFMKLAHQVEQEAFDKNKNILKNRYHPGFYNTKMTFDPNDHSIITNPSTDAKRNHFPDLIALLDGYKDFVACEVEDKDGKKAEIPLDEVLRELRNAAAHNRYPEAYIFAQLKKNSQKEKQIVNVQNIIGLILKFANGKIDEMKNNLPVGK